MARWLSFRDVDAYFADGQETYYRAASMPPFWSVITRGDYGGPKEKADAILKYINLSIEQLLEWRYPITRVQRLNTALYAGRHNIEDLVYSLDPRVIRRNFDKSRAKIVLNYIGKATDHHVSKMAGYEPNLTVSPKNDEEKDRVSARMNKQLLDHYFYILNLKTQFLTFHRRKKVQGEAFYFVQWNKDLGDYHPKYKAYRDMVFSQGGDPDAPIPLVDPASGAPLLDEQGNPLFITQAIRTGDVSLEQEYSERVLYPCPQSCLWSDVPWIHRLMFVPFEEVRGRWPHVADDIKRDSMYRQYVGPQRSLEDLVCLRYSYVKPSRFLDRGFTCWSVESTICQMGEKEFNHDELPCIRGTDIDIDFEITGMSFIQNLSSLNYALNNSTSMILQNQSLFARPKYAVPKGSKVRFLELNDDQGIYEYSGPRPPEVIATNSTPQDTWRWRDAIRDEFKTLSGIFDTSTGRPPGNITANVALRMIDEQEREFHKPAIDKHSQNVKQLGELMLATVGTYRDPEDGVLINVLGKNNERYLKYFDVQSLSIPYEVELVRSSGLPEEPAAKVQTVLDLSERFPELWSNDEVLEQLDIAKPERLIESATVARQCAESEVEDILSGLPVPPPTQYQDLIPKYKVYSKAVQSRAFTESAPAIQQAMLTHLLTAEYLMMKKMEVNPVYAQKVNLELSNFPAVFPQLNPQALVTLATPTVPGGVGMGMDPMAGMMPPPGMENAAPLGGLPPEAASAPMPPSEPMIEPAPAAPVQQPAPQPSSPVINVNVMDGGNGSAKRKKITFEQDENGKTIGGFVDEGDLP